MSMRRGSQYRRKYMASPIFSLTNPSTITAGSKWIYDYATSKPVSVKYHPFNTVMITNDSSVPVNVWVNQNPDKKKMCAAGQTLTLGKEDGINLVTFILENLDSTTTVAIGEIEVAAFNLAHDSEDVVASVHKKILGLLYGK